MRRFLHILAAAWTCLFVSVSGQAQIAFRPHVETFGKLHYGADSQNWSVAEGSPGEIFVGNDEGLLRYDGYRWELNRLPGGSPVYSILVDGDRIYTGGVREFGYWTRTPEGEFGYHSLSAGMEEDRLGRDEIWTILKQGDRILFHAFHAFHAVSPEKTTTFRTPSFMMSPHILESGELLVYLRGEGLAVLDIDADGGGAIFVCLRGFLSGLPWPPFLRRRTGRTVSSRTGRASSGWRASGWTLFPPRPTAS